MTRGTASDVVDLETGELYGEHIKDELVAELWATFLNESAGANAVVVEHFISPLTCRRCGNIVKDYTTKV